MNRAIEPSRHCRWFGHERRDIVLVALLVWRTQQGIHFDAPTCLRRNSCFSLVWVENRPPRCDRTKAGGQQASGIVLAKLANATSWVGDQIDYRKALFDQ